MNKLSKMTGKLVAAAQILAITLLAACTLGTPRQPSAMPQATRRTRTKKSLSTALN